MIEMSPTEALETVYARDGAKVLSAEIIAIVRPPVEGMFS
jgi:hypothetical protein